MVQDRAAFSLLLGFILAILAAVMGPDVAEASERVSMALFTLGIFLMSSEAMRGAAYDVAHASRCSIFGLIHAVTHFVYFCLIMMLLLGVDPSSRAAVGPWVAGVVFGVLMLVLRKRNLPAPTGLDLSRPSFGPGRWAGFTVVALALPVFLLASFQLDWGGLGARNTDFYFFLSALAAQGLQRYPTTGGFWAPFALLRLFAMVCLVAAILLPRWV